MAFEWSERLTGELLIFGLLSKALYTYPERDWLNALISEGVFAEAPFAADEPGVTAALARLQTWAESNRGGISDAAFDDLRADYTHLFIGPGDVKVAPWESVHFSDDRLIFQKETLQVREWYRRFGLQLQRLHNEPDDHIGLELEFVAHLAQLALGALEKNSPELLEQLLDAQRAFLSEHLLQWGYKFCGEVEENAHTEFFKGIARLTCGALDGATRMLGITTPGGSAA